MRINLATRPFYNERAVTALLVLVGLVAVGLTVFNVTELISLSARRTALQTQIARDEAATKTAEASAQSLQRTVDRAALGVLAYETSEANALISERTFSWTTFLGLIEKTLPQDVHLVSVAPRVDDGQMWITMMVIAKTADDQAKFMDALEGTGAFFEVQARDEDITEEGMRRATMRARYIEPPMAPALPAASATSSTDVAPAAKPADKSTPPPATAAKPNAPPGKAAAPARGKGGRS